MPVLVFCTHELPAMQVAARHVPVSSFMSSVFIYSEICLDYAAKLLMYGYAGGIWITELAVWNNQNCWDSSYVLTGIQL